MRTLGTGCMMVSKKETRGLNCQAISGMLRSALFTEYHDLDQTNAQMSILLQVVQMVTHDDGRAPIELAGLQYWVDNRAAMIQEVAEFHGLPTDEERWPGFRKEHIKTMVIAFVFGRKYSTWIRNTLYKEIFSGGRSADKEPRHSPRGHRARRQGPPRARFRVHGVARFCPCRPRAPAAGE